MTTEGSGPRRTIRPLLCDLALAAVILLVYAQSVKFDFAKVDDGAYVTENPHVSTGLSMANVAWAFRSFESSNWHPLTWISLMTDASLGGGKPWIFHATNVAMHAINAIVLFHVLLTATRGIGKSLFVAALFAVHPLHVESVAWVTERKDVLSTLFWFLAMAAHVAYVRRPGPLRYAAITLCMVLGALSKPMVVTLPVTLLLLDFWPLERPLGRALVVEKLPLMAIAVASGVVTLVAQASIAASLTQVPLQTRLAEAVVAYGAYAAKMVWPVGLSVHHVFESPLPSLLVALSAVLFAAATTAAVVFRHRHRYVTFGWLWYVVTLVPVIGFVKVGEQSIADRYTYVPLIGLFVVVAWGIPDLVRAELPAAHRRSGLLPGAAVVAVSALIVLAHRQTGYWRNAYELFRHAVDVNAISTLARTGLGQELALRGRDAEAIEQLRSALAARPGETIARRRLAECLERTGRLDEASAEYLALLRSDPEDAAAGLGLGVVLLERDDPRSAAEVLSRAKVLAPGDARVRATLGLALTRLERSQEAESELTEALRLDPESVIAHQGLAVVLGNAGRTDEAIAHLRQALSIGPAQPGMRENLAKLLLRQGKSEEAAAVLSGRR